MSQNLAVVGSSALVYDLGNDVRGQLGQETSLIEQRAAQITVTDSLSAEAATAFKKQISQFKKRVEAYWEPVRADAKRAYDSVLAKKKEMLTPLDRAEKAVAKKINDYAYETEMKRRREEEARQKLIQAEIDRKLAEAAQAETAGDAMGAEMAMAEAEVYDGLGAAKAETPGKLNGMTQKLGWEIVSLAPAQVPITICGIEVHISNKAVVEQLVRKAIELSGGKAEIPGVIYRETMKVSVR